MIVDIIYDDSQIYHVLHPIEEGIRGVPINQKMMRESIENVRVYLAHLDQTKIDKFVEEENRNNQH